MARKSFGYAAVCVELSMQHMKLPFQLVGARFVKKKTCWSKLEFFWWL
jgi:hypothetical protein